MAEHKIDGNDGAGNVDLIRRIDAMQACQVGPSDEWAKATKDGYNQAATDCAAAILRVDSATSVSVHGWQPIDTAPKGGTGCMTGYFDQFGNFHYAISYWSEIGWIVARTDMLFYPTHWTPLPCPPAMPLPAIEY